MACVSGRLVIFGRPPMFIDDLSTFTYASGPKLYLHLALLLLTALTDIMVTLEFFAVDHVSLMMHSRRTQRHSQFVLVACRAIKVCPSQPSSYLSAPSIHLRA